MRNGFFCWLNIKEFMNTYQEWHAFVEGFSESFCFWRAHIEPSEELLNDIKNEHHYYVFGRVVGFIGLVGLGLFIFRAVRGKTMVRGMQDRVYRSHYEYTCKDCRQPIKPQTPYHLRTRYENFQGNTIMTFEWLHVECPGVNHEEK